MSIFDSEEHPHAFANQVEICKDHQEIHGVNGISKWQVVWYVENPGEVEEEIDSRKEEICRSCKTFVFS